MCLLSFLLSARNFLFILLVFLKFSMSTRINLVLVCFLVALGLFSALTNHLVHVLRHGLVGWPYKLILIVLFNSRVSHASGGEVGLDELF